MVAHSADQFHRRRRLVLPDAFAEPLGADREIAEIILARYAVGAVDLVDLDALFAEV
jgi:hypothetical protein